jgi:hypothetical protein
MHGKAYYRITWGEFLKVADHFLEAHAIPCDSSVSEITKSTEMVVCAHGQEAGHLMLESMKTCHPMSLVVSGNKLCPDCALSLSSHGVDANDTMFTAAQKLGKIHVGLRPSRF